MLFLNILTLPACTDNLFPTLMDTENEYFLIYNLLCFFTGVKLMRLRVQCPTSTAVVDSLAIVLPQPVTPKKRLVLSIHRSFLSIGHFYLASVPGEVKDPTQGVNV